MKSKDTLIELIKDVASQVLPEGAQLILFGSRARGEAREGSDWDLLVLIDKDRVEYSDYDDIVYPLSITGWETGDMVNPIIYTKSEWQDNRITPFYQNVMKEGIVLWA